MSNRKIICPNYKELINPTFLALKQLGGSGTNNEIHDKIISILNLSEDQIDQSHLGSTNQTELQYQLAWARTYLKNYGVIVSLGRSVWAISNNFSNVDKIDEKLVIKNIQQSSKNVDNNHSVPEDRSEQNDYLEYPEEAKPWRKHLLDTLHAMNPYAFERLSQRILRECGFDPVTVTKKSGDGGIDGTGKLKINGILSFNVAFQCKRYKGSVTASEIRDFRGSLTTDIEKGIFITTGIFTKAAKDEANVPGKLQIDLIDGERLIDMLAELKIGLKEIVTYEVDESFFFNL